ncbi:MAG: AAA family ATPase [Oscillospiraceae bacterium]|jgi:chromosome partitioning protein|nr:AAA family ATPase [Oscillospiraceae bacterium]
MGKIIAIANQKGGVGKTTTAVNLSAAVGAKGKRVLLVDSDPQGNTTGGLGVDKRAMQASVYNLLLGKPAAEIIARTQFEGLDLIPSGMELAGAELELANLDRRESRLKTELSAVRQNYDYIFIDCPPSLGLITLNALTAADTLLVPIQCEYFALEGLSQLMTTVRQIKRLYNPQLEIEGVLLTMFDGRLNLTQQVVREVKKFFPKQVFGAAIPRSVRLSEAPSFGLPILYYDRGSKGAASYNDLAGELIKKQRVTH